jgi:hypothetical protein
VSVAASSDTIVAGTVGVPTLATIPAGPTRSVPMSVYGEATSPRLSPGAIWKIRSRPPERPTPTRAPFGRNPYDDRSNSQAGSANSASIGVRFSSLGPGASR